MVKHWNIEWGTADHLRVEPWNNQGGRVELRWWNSRTSNGGGLEQWKRDDETVNL